MVYNFNEEINEESVQRFLKFVNEIPPLGNTTEGDIIKEDLTLYLKSIGGDYDLATLIIDVINNYEGTVHLVGYGQLASSAFDIFFESTPTYKRLIDGTAGMYHMVSVGIEINEKGKGKDDTASSLVDRIKYIGESRTKQMIKKLKMTTKEAGVILRGGDLFVSPQRMQAFLENSLKNEHKSK